MNLKNIVHKLTILFVVIVVTSCNSNAQIKSEVNYWKGKQLVLPTDKQIFNNRDKTSPISKKIKIMSVINGGCGPCVEELQEWKKFMKGIDTTYVGFVFLVNSVDQIRDFKVKDSLSINLNYPYYYDKLNKITEKNKFSENKLYQTFLLDEKNTVVLLGKPNTSEMYELYRSQIYKMEKKAIKGTTVSRNAGVSTTNVPGNYTFKDEKGNVLDQKKAEEMMNSHKYMPSINDRDQIITLKLR